ncbi:MAG: alpha-amylase, partial [Deltaproteobacteria bacterium]|nr:alpha-amylase [Deltaproteobacteria bacterium]
MKIYNLFPLLAGKVKQWPPHLERAAEMGFDWVFVNPIQKPGRSGSLYSIADYFQINPLLVNGRSQKSSEAQVKEVARAAEELGLKLMIDLVINHCATDAKLVKEHPEWFIQEPDGSVAHPYCMEDGKKVIWEDLARFDHEHTADPEGLYRFFFEIVEYLVQLGFKGFRCDAAYQIPGQLWRRLISETKARHSDILFTAETLGCSADQTKRTAQAGFDYIFNSAKWWNFKSPWLLEQYNLTRDAVPSIAFPESHDTERLFEESNGNENALKQRYLFTAVFSSGVMMPIGYEFGFRKKLHVAKTRPKDWEEPNIDLTDFIKKVNSIKARYQIFQEECPTEILSDDNPNILLLWKASCKGSEEALIILNKDIQNRQPFYVDDIYQYVQSKA